MRKRQKRPIFDEKKSYNNRGSKRTIHSSTFNMIREKSLFLHFTNKYVVILRISNLDLCSSYTNIKLLLLGDL